MQPLSLTRALHWFRKQSLKNLKLTSKELPQKSQRKQNNFTTTNKIPLLNTRQTSLFLKQRLSQRKPLKLTEVETAEPEQPTKEVAPAALEDTPDEAVVKAEELEQSTSAEELSNPLPRRQKKKKVEGDN